MWDVSARGTGLWESESCGAQFWACLGSFGNTLFGYRTRGTMAPIVKSSCDEKFLVLGSEMNFSGVELKTTMIIDSEFINILLQSSPWHY